MMSIEARNLGIDVDNPAVGSWKRKLRLALLVLATAPLIVLAAGFIYQWIAELYDARAYPMPGKLVDAGNVELHVYCTGPRNAGPTIVLVPGMGSVSTTFANVQRPLSANWTVCTYDRDGLGWSHDSGAPRDAAVASRRLHKVLHSMDVPQPYVLVGHSYGGLVTRVFADEYPSEVSGMVLVDSAHEDMGERFPPEAGAGFKELLAGFGKLYLLNHAGVPRAMNMMAPMIDGLDGRMRDASMSRLNTIDHSHASAREAEGWDRSAARAREIRDFGDLPLAVLVATGWPEFMLPSWIAMQEDLASLSTRGSIELVEGATHPRIVMDVRYAPRVVAAVERVIGFASTEPGVDPTNVQ